KIETTTQALKTIDVYDISGKVMLKYTSNQSVIELNTSKLPNGIYFVKVKTDTKSGYFKVVKE
ncbi:MAG TPA: T9SS type A sorting domain-containing protein, partial [Aquaticitalea sp.]|nr:T9SS type A sorting domain-containing protein [Aquaticitalea sp.]